MTTDPQNPPNEAPSDLQSPAPESDPPPPQSEPPFEVPELDRIIEAAFDDE